MSLHQFAAASLAACTTLAILSAVVSISEPQRTALTARHQAGPASETIRVAADVQPAPRLHTAQDTATNAE
jgi:hypothetical protein